MLAITGILLFSGCIEETEETTTTTTQTTTTTTTTSTTTTTTTTTTKIDCPPISIITQCSDSDRGINIYKKGTITGFFVMPQASFNHTDTCLNETTVKEYFCNTTGCCHGVCVIIKDSKEITCPENYYCVDGKCTQKTNPPHP